MGVKQDPSQPAGKGKPRVPSTGLGAASALDALIKRRIPPAPPPPQPPAKKR
jgi:hypothetical protein